MTRSDLRKSVEGNVEHVGYINSVKLLQTCLAILCKKTGFKKNSAGLISTMSIDFTVVMNYISSPKQSLLS